MKNTYTTRKTNKILFSIVVLLSMLFVVFGHSIPASASSNGYVNATYLCLRTGPGTEHNVIDLISNATVTILGTAYDGNGDLWYHVNYNGTEGYVFGDYVIDMGESTSDSTSQSNASSLTFEQQLLMFPESYRDGLRAIHSVYPNYIFQADYINMTFKEVVLEEIKPQRKLVSMSEDGVSWRALGSNYDRNTGWWTTCSGGWTDAAVNVVEYYLDPRNFLNTNTIYVFAQQTYSGNETAEGVRSIVGNSFLAGTYTDKTGTHSYVDTIMEACADAGVSPYVVASIIAIEQPYDGGSSLINGVYGYYNFMNDGACGGSETEVINNGIAFAQSYGWDTVYKSIYGGALIYGQEYLFNGQDTYYYKDFNVYNGNFYHQYAQSIYDQLFNSYGLRSVFSGNYSATVTFRIPVYKEMLASPAPKVPETGELNTHYTNNGTAILNSGETVVNQKVSASDLISQTEPVSNPTNETSTDSSTEPTTEPAAQSDTEPASEIQPVSPKTTLQSGDANGDGKISSLDYISVKNHIMGRNIISDSEKLAAADVNGDGKISALDYISIKKIIMSK